MTLMEVKEDNGWLYSDWKLAYRVGWEQICKGIAAVGGSFGNPEVLIDGESVKIHSGKDIMELEEAGNLTIRGISEILKVPVMITLFNQINAAKVLVAAATEEFQDTDYEQFNISMSQFLDSVEIAMHR